MNSSPTRIATSHPLRLLSSLPVLLLLLVTRLPAQTPAQIPAQSPSLNPAASTAAAAAAAQSGQQQPAPVRPGTHPEAGEPTQPPSTAPAPLPPVPTGRPSIGLALGGGGALAMSEVGVLQWFEEHHIPIDMVAGTSMGCMVGALYSTGHTVDQLKTVMNGDVFSSVFRFQSAYATRSFRRREDSRDLPNALTVGLKHGVSLRNSLLTDQGLNAFLDREFLRYDDQTDFNSLPIPLRCLATDLTDARTVTFARGNLPDAVRASVSLPGVYRPFEKNGHAFVDGGVLENLPTQTIHAMHADVVLAVSLPLAPVGKGELSSLLGVLQRSFSVAIEADERRSRALANVVLMPDITGFTSTDYLKIGDLAQRGYAAAESQKAALLPYAVSDAEWAKYLAQREARRRGPMGPLLHLRVRYQGGPPNAAVTRAVEARFAPLLNHPIDTTTIDKLLDQVRADGRYDADYALDFDTPADEAAGRPSILVTVADKNTGPPFLLVGANVEGQTSGVTHANVEGILLDQDLGGYGSELRSRIRLGFDTDLSTEYYRVLPAALNLGGGSLFLAPRAAIVRDPFYIYQNQQRLAERQLQTLGGGLDLGWGNQSTAELRAGWERNRTDWNTLVGSDAGSPYQAPFTLSGSAQRARIQFTYDTEDRALVPRFGLHSITSIGYLYNAVSSPNAPYFTTADTYSHEIGKNVFVMGVQAGTLFDRTVAQPFRFTLGGPLRLSASAIDEYRGTDYFLLDPAFLHRIASLPAPLGQSLYLGFAYEAGQMHAPNTPTVTRQDFLFGIVAETPLGVFTLAPSIGDDGHRKLNFTLGKFF